MKQEAGHRLLTVKLIATPAKEFVTCERDESPKQVRQRQRSDLPFDYLPVREPAGPIIGFFSVRCPDHDNAERVVNSPGFVHLSERHLIGARTPILEFIQRANDTPQPYLVVEGQGIYGLLNSANLVHPLVGAAIAVRIIEFETQLNRWIKERYQADTWRHIGKKDLDEIDRRYKKAKCKRIEATHAWMHGDLSHKMTILKVDSVFGDKIKDLRNEVFHTRPPTEIQDGLKALERVLDNLEADDTEAM